MERDAVNAPVSRRAVMSSGAAAGLLGACGGTAAQTPPGASLQILAPRVEGMATTNLKEPGDPPHSSYTYAIADEDARVGSALVPLLVMAPGLRNVEAFLHGRLVARLTPGVDGMARGQLDLREEMRGPLVLEVAAWDGPAGYNSISVLLKMRVILFVETGGDPSPPPP